VTPDSVEILAEFSRCHEVGYPMLSDVGGVVVEQYGILNPNIPPDAAGQRQGLPFPGHFLLAPDGSVLGKAFSGDLRHRPGGTLLVFEHFGGSGEPGVHIGTRELQADITCSNARLFPGQELSLRIGLHIEPEWHLYGPAVASPYVPLSIQFEAGEDSVLAEQSFDVPAGVPVTLPSSGETLPLLSGSLEVKGRLRLRWSPPASRFPEMAAAVRARQGPTGDQRLQGTLRFQACSDSVCLPPVALGFSLPIFIEGHVAV